MLYLRYYVYPLKRYTKFHDIIAETGKINLISTNGVFLKNMIDKRDEISDDDFSRIKISEIFSKNDDILDYKKIINNLYDIILKSDEEKIIINDFSDIFHFITTENIISERDLLTRDGKFDKEKFFEDETYKKVYDRIYSEIDDCLTLLKETGKEIIMLFNFNKIKVKEHLLKKKFGKYFKKIKIIKKGVFLSRMLFKPPLHPKG